MKLIGFLQLQQGYGTLEDCFGLCKILGVVRITAKIKFTAAGFCHTEHL